MKSHFSPYLAAAVAFTSVPVLGQVDFDPTVAGPWSQPGKTTLMVPKVPNNSINLDGASTAAEYGGFNGVTVIPAPTGSTDNGWILGGFPADANWEGPNDSSFTFFLAHDDNYFYVGVQTKDDVVNSDNNNENFWQDDAIEIVVDALADRFDNNTDSSKDEYGGHNYLNYQGRFSGWDDVNDEKNTSRTWASAVGWRYGKTNEIFGFGKAVGGGWQMEARFHKSMFEDPAKGNKLRNGYRMGFNIGLDDDDKHGKVADGKNGDGTRSTDLEIQYFWANRARFKGYNAAYVAGLSPEDLAKQVWRTDTEFAPVINNDGRLAHGGTGEIIFGYDLDKKSTGKILFVTANADSPGNADAALIALFQAKGYEVTVFNSGGQATEPEELRAAAAGKQLVFISETIGSGTVLDPVNVATAGFALHDTDVPIVSFEAYMYDNAGWVKVSPEWATGGANDFVGWGNTARSEVTALGTDPGVQDSLHIRKPGHPIAGGLTGKVKVYNFPYSFNFGLPSAEADIIASVNADGTYPSLFVYEKGKKLSDGTVAPNKRIGLFLGQTANPDANYPVDFAVLTEDGKALLLNTIAYAVGATTVPPTLAIARKGADIVITYAGGTLQSSSTLNGTFAAEAGASPLTVANPAGTKFYRVR